MQKQLKLFLVLFLFSAAAVPLFAQQDSVAGISLQAYGRQYPLEVNDKITTVLIFPCEIVRGSVDRGSGDIIAKVSEGTSNVLKVKSVMPGLQPTNLTVITTDGRVWSFRVMYSANTDGKPLDMAKQVQSEAQTAFLRNRVLNDEQVKKTAQHIATRKPFLHRPKARSFKVVARLKGIYIADDVIFFRVDIKNKTQIDYALDFIRFYVRDKKRIKRTAEQEQELSPLYMYKNQGDVIAGKTIASVVIAFKKFTIADHKNFAVQLFEKGGDRNPELKIDGSDIIRAQNLSLPFNL